MRGLAISIGIFIAVPTISFTQTVKSNTPKLVVGIVVDQMRNDYIYRYWDRFGKGGFKRLVTEGYYFRNTHYNYIPTYTGPGHCSIYTGTVPRYHGIIANDWYVESKRTSIYCVDDSTMKTVGSDSKAGRMSPRRQMSTTIGDELKLSTMNKGKVFAVALKDRSSVLPAGHSADGAFWLDESNGSFVSSSWYMKELPKWVEQFNQRKLAKAYLSTPWNTLYPIETYTNSLPDDNPYEALVFGKPKPVFPYDLSEFVKNHNYGIIRVTPYGNALTREMAVACIKQEALGKDAIPDLISISFSSTDYVGHSFGPRSIEVEDTYLRLDKEIEELLNFLDSEIGSKNYMVFLTADHGASEVPQQLIDERLPGGYLSEKSVAREVKAFLGRTYNDTLLFAKLSNEQVFLDNKRVNDKNLNPDLIEKQLCELLVTMKGVAAAYPSQLLKHDNGRDNEQLQLLQNGYHLKISGNVAYLYESGYLDSPKQGTSHGTGYTYDTHVPLIFFGVGIPKGENFSQTVITQIAPTVSEILGISRPSACKSEPLNNSFR